MADQIRDTLAFRATLTFEDLIEELVRSASF